MDCVACQNCRIHGKLSMLGIATGLKVFLDQDEVHLQRNEAIALVNTLYKFSESIRVFELMRERVFWIFLERAIISSTIGIFIIILLFSIKHLLKSRNNDSKKPKQQ